MKQTNSAVNMLKHAYLSIYKKAYLKGITPAVALALSGLAATGAVAAPAADNDSDGLSAANTADDGFDYGSFAEGSYDSDDLASLLGVTHDDDIDGSSNLLADTNLKAADSASVASPTNDLSSILAEAEDSNEQQPAANFSGTIAQSADAAKDYTVGSQESYTGAGGHFKNLTIDSSLELKDLTGHVRVDNITVSSGGKLDLTNATQAAGVIGSHDDNFSGNSSFDIKGGTVNVKHSQIQTNNVTITAGDVTLGGNIGDNGDSDWADNAQINAIGASSTTGNFKMAGGTINMDDGSVLNALSYELTGGTINLQGTDRSDGTKSAIIRAYSQSAGEDPSTSPAIDGSIKINGATINALGGGSYLVGKKITMTGANSAINVGSSGDLTIGAGLAKQNISSSIAHDVSGSASFEGGTLNNEGTLRINGTAVVTGDTKFTNKGKVVVGNYTASDAQQYGSKFVLDQQNPGYDPNEQLKHPSQIKDRIIDLEGKYQVESGSTLRINKGWYKLTADNFVKEEAAPSEDESAPGTGQGEGTDQGEGEVDGSQGAQLNAKASGTTEVQGQQGTIEVGAGAIVTVDSMDELRKLGSVYLEDGDPASNEDGLLHIYNDVTVTKDDFGQDKLHGNGGTFSADNLTISGDSLDTNGVEVMGLSNITIKHTGDKFVLNNAKDTELHNEIGASGNFEIQNEKGEIGTIQINKGNSIYFDHFNNTETTAVVKGNFEVNSGSISFSAGKIDASASSINMTGGGKVEFYGDDPLNNRTNVTLGSLQISGGSVEVNDADVTIKDINLNQGNVKISDSSAAKNSNLTVTDKYVATEKQVEVHTAGTFEVGANLVKDFKFTEQGAASSDPDSDAETFADGTSKTYTLDTGTNFSGDKSIVLSGGTAKFDFASGSTLNSDQIKQLGTQLISNYKQEGYSGFINIGDAAIAGVSDKIDKETGKIDYKDYINAAGGDDVISNATNNELASATVSGVGSADQLNGSFGAVELSSGNSSLQIKDGGQLQLNGAKIDNGYLVSTIDGKAANVSGNNVTLTFAGDGSVADITLNEKSTIAISGKVTTGNIANASGTATITGSAKTGDITLADLLINGGAVDASSTDGKQNVKVNNLNIAASGSLNADNITINGSGETSNTTIAGSVVSKNIEANNTFVTIHGNGSVKSNTLVANNTNIRVGVEGQDSSSGSLDVDSLVMNGGQIVVDPEFGQKTATFAVRTISSKTGDTADNTLAADLVVGKNAAAGIGMTESELNQAIARYQTNGSLSSGDHAAIAMINTTGIKVADQKKIVVGGNEEASTLVQKGEANSLYLGEGGVVQFTAKGLSEDQASVQFLGNNSSIIGDGGKFIMPAGATSEQMANAFVDSTGKEVAIAANSKDVTVTTENGLYSAVVKAGQSLKDVKLELTGDSRGTLKDMSDPVYDYTMDVLGKVSDLQANLKPEELEGVYFLQEAAGKEGGGAAETVARAVANSGVVQAQNLVQRASNNAIAARTGMSTNSNILVAENNVSGVWFNPIYGHSNSSGFGAQGVNTGSDVDIYGASLGYDYGVTDFARVGVMVQAGGGSTKGKQAATGVKNDISFFGAGVYAGFKPLTNLNVAADLTYNRYDNSMTIDTGLKSYQSLSADFNASTLSVGVNTSYDVVVDEATKISPHVGLRYTNYSFDNFDVKHKDSVIAKNSADNLGVVSIPVGVSINRDIQVNDWKVSPSADISITANAGGTKLKNGFTFVKGMDSQAKTEVLDSVVYGVGVGVGASNGNFNVGVGLNYQGSKNTSDIGVNAQVGYRF